MTRKVARPPSGLLASERMRWRCRTLLATTDVGRGSFINDPKIRGIFFQAVVVILLFALRLLDRRQHDREPAAIQHLVGLRLSSTAAPASTSAPASSRSVRTRPMPAGLSSASSTRCWLQCAASSPRRSSVSSVGVGRLSHNWLIRKICTVYVEIFRNIPPLLVIFFWYFGVLSVLPQPRESIHLGIPLGGENFISFGTYLNNRGIFLPMPVWGQGSWLILAGLVVGIAIDDLRRPTGKDTAGSDRRAVPGLLDRRRPDRRACRCLRSCWPAFR